MQGIDTDRADVVAKKQLRMSSTATSKINIVFRVFFNNEAFIVYLEEIADTAPKCGMRVLDVLGDG